MKLAQKNLMYFLAIIIFVGDRVGRFFLMSASQGQNWVEQNIIGPFSLAVSNNIMLVVMVLILILVGVGLFFWRKERLPLFIIFLAGLNNFIDRLLYGGVIDYWPWFNLGHFNLSDALLFFALIYFVYTLFRSRNL
ncbi:MAG: Lipoprotein signal peptidase [Parcubacteria group bacterium GW2011_GWA2_44_15]|nr:MAG: Lipoprotein signal peptidase [Parcubacteria group bacterium GW2011_GWA2_44_15]